MEHHIVYSDRAQDWINSPYLAIYRQVRDDFFSLFEGEGSALEDIFWEYEPFLDMDMTQANATFTWLS